MKTSSETTAQPNLVGPVLYWFIDPTSINYSYLTCCNYNFHIYKPYSSSIQLFTQLTKLSGAQTKTKKPSSPTKRPRWTKLRMTHLVSSACATFTPTKTMRSGAKWSNRYWRTVSGVKYAMDLVVDDGVERDGECLKVSTAVHCNYWFNIRVYIYNIWLYETRDCRSKTLQLRRTS